MRMRDLFKFKWGHTPILAVLLLAAGSLSAQEPRPTLFLQTATGQTTFHIGERIPLKLTFTSPNDTQYIIPPWSNGADRRSCPQFDYEHPEVSPPTGWSDPLATYFANALCVGGGPSWPRFLNSKPVRLSLDLNQWVRFDQPGVYRVTIVSRRVRERSNPSGHPVTLQSNPIELHIVPATPQWRSATLGTALQRLKSGGPLAEVAAAQLRYLATPATVNAMTYELREGYTPLAEQCSLGLIGLPDSIRDLAIASMNKRLDEPGFPITTLFVTTMSFLHVRPGSSAKSIFRQKQRFESGFWQTVFSSVSKKEGAARAQTVQTLLNLEPTPSPEPPEVQSQMRAWLAVSFLDLDVLSQIDDLRQRWGMLDSPGILPALRTLAESPPMSDHYSSPYSREDLRSVAFKRWYELDPTGARKEILAEIGSPTPPLSAQALTFLPAKPLPQFERLWADAFVKIKTTDQTNPSAQRREDLLGSLLVRFGTGAAVPQMIAKLNQPPSPYACIAYGEALAYLVRFSPHDARRLLKRQIATKEPDCSDSMFRRIYDQAAGPVLNEVADEALNNPDPGVVEDAASYLTLYGRKSDEKYIWQRYVKWTREWSGKKSALEHPGPGAPSDPYLGEMLGHALIANQGWLANHALISRVLQMCVVKPWCKSLENDAALAKPPYHVVLPDTSDPFGIDFRPSYRVAQYRMMSRMLLEAKIRQYPRGTKFVLVGLGFQTENQRKLDDEIRALFKKNGMLLERSTN